MRCKVAIAAVSEMSLHGASWWDPSPTSCYQMASALILSACQQRLGSLEAIGLTDIGPIAIISATGLGEVVEVITWRQMTLVHTDVAVAILPAFLPFLIIARIPVRTAANSPCSTIVLTAATLLITLTSVPTLLALIQNAGLASMVIENAIAVLPALQCLLGIACIPISAAAHSTRTTIS